MPEKVSIPVIVSSLPRTGMPIATGFISVEELIPRARIAHREFAAGSGYQRLPSASRVNALARSLRTNKVDLPTALLLNLRNYEPSRNLVEGQNGSALLCLTDEELWEVDGQHRCEGLKAAYNEDPKRFGDYVIPFVAGLGWSEEYEMRQFFVVNSNAKSVPTTIAYDLLSNLGQTVPELMDDLEGTGKAWQVHGQELAVEMSKSSLIWRGRIRFSNEPKGISTVPGAGFVNSLKPILQSPYFGRLTKGVQARVLNAYWEAQRNILPGVFMEPQDYVLQKSMGVQVMHGIFNDVLEVVRANGDPVTEPHGYVAALEQALMDLSGDTRAGSQVSGEDFWLSGEHGAAGAFSSSAGRRVLTVRLKNGLPKIA